MHLCSIVNLPSNYILLTSVVLVNQNFRLINIEVELQSENIKIFLTIDYSFMVAFWVLTGMQPHLFAIPTS